MDNLVNIEYRNVIELIFEDLVRQNQLDILPDDDIDLIEDATCATLGKIRPIYIKNHVDFFYSISNEELEKMKLEVKGKFKTHIDLFREEDDVAGDREWKD